jgi:hypothetical protein
MRVLLILALLVPAAAGAQDLAETHFSMNFCWDVSYSTAHLAEHPEKTVTAFRVSREPAGFPTAPGQTAMELEATFRDGNGGRGGEEAAVIGLCEPDGDNRLVCALHANAGNYRIERQGPGRSCSRSAIRG